LPAILRGPRVERRRVLSNGSPYWGTVQSDGTLLLDDGRTVALESVQSATTPSRPRRPRTS